MINVIGVKFRTAGKIYYFDPLDFDIQYRDNVIVETARGVEFGTVMMAPKKVTDDMVIQPLKPVLRVATMEDKQTYKDNCAKEKEAYSICLAKIAEHGLDMKLIDTEYTFDRNKVLFYFTADGRIDFRALVKDLAAIFHTRIELRQIGVRDETKLIGGIGICGRPLCCNTYLTDFVPVSIKMAKEQNLSLNPTKISGVCGRLMCCLKNEEDAYEYLNSKLPSIGSRVTTPDDLQGEVQSVNVLKQLVKVIITTEDDEKEIHEYSVGELRFKRKKEIHSHYDESEVIDKELADLEKLDLEEKTDGLEDEATPSVTKPARREGKRSNHRRKNSDHKEQTSQNENNGANHNISGKDNHSGSTKERNDTDKKESHNSNNRHHEGKKPFRDEKTAHHKSSHRETSSDTKETEASKNDSVRGKGRYNNHHNNRGNRNNGIKR